MTECVILTKDEYEKLLKNERAAYDIGFKDGKKTKTRSGYWVRVKGNVIYTWECSECGNWQEKQTSFCSGCGAEMEVDDEENC